MYKSPLYHPRPICYRFIEYWMTDGIGLERGTEPQAVQVVLAPFASVQNAHLFFHLCCSYRYITEKGTSFIITRGGSTAQYWSTLLSHWIYFLPFPLVLTITFPLLLHEIIGCLLVYVTRKEISSFVSFDHLCEDVRYQISEENHEISREGIFPVTGPKITRWRGRYSMRQQTSSLPTFCFYWGTYWIM